MSVKLESQAGKSQIDEKIPYLRGYVVPHDSDDPRYVKSFFIQEDKAIKEFFDRFGFVIIREVATKSDCDKTIDEMWSVVTEMAKRKGNVVERSNPATWDNGTWPGHIPGGFLGDIDFPTPQAFENRQNPILFQAFELLFGHEDLFVSYDRYALFRPTKDVLINGTLQDKPEWKSSKNLHIDMNPFNFVKGKKEDSEAFAQAVQYKTLEDFFDESDAVSVGVMSENRLSVQGQLNLLDNIDEDGGFVLVPGFKDHIAQWVDENDAQYGNTWEAHAGNCPFPQSDPLIKSEIRITARAGSLIIWNQLTPHGSAPCQTAKGRYTQFIKMIPGSLLTEDQKVRRSVALRKQIELSKFEDKISPKVGRRIFGADLIKA